MRMGPHYLRIAREHPGWTTLMRMAKGDSRHQQFGLQFLGSAWSKMATQERLDLVRLYIEKISQDLRVVTLAGLGVTPLNFARKRPLALKAN